MTNRTASEQLDQFNIGENVVVLYKNGCMAQREIVETSDTTFTISEPWGERVISKNTRKPLILRNLSCVMPILNIEHVKTMKEWDFSSMSKP